MEFLGITLADWVFCFGVANIAAAVAVATMSDRAPPKRDLAVSAFLLLATSCFGFAIAERWMRIGHGPFTTMFEILLSNLFSLGLIYGITYWRVPRSRPGAIVALPVLLLIGIWALVSPSEASHLPPTYENPWLWVHVAMGKLFLSTCLVATGVAGFLLLRGTGLFADPLPATTSDGSTLDKTAWQFLALAFVFHSLMLISGAVWAQDAWGRYWAWDPLETWAFATWLFAAIALHGRVAFRMPGWVGWCLIVGVFVLAFLTFFGVPFVSVSPHKGAI